MPEPTTIGQASRSSAGEWQAQDLLGYKQRMRVRVLLGIGVTVWVVALGCRPKESKDQSPRPSEKAEAGKASPPPRRAEWSRSLLGGERGIDHVNVAVRDLEAARRTFHERLGFGRPIAGKLPNGIQNINYHFGDGTYLETMTAWDRAKAPWVAEFLDKQEGPMKLVLSVHSVSGSAKFLRSRGIGTTIEPGSIQVQGAKQTSSWSKLLLQRSTIPGDCVFLIAYEQRARRDFLDKLKLEGVRRRFFSHPNTALGIRAVWIAVEDLGQATMAFDNIGLPAGGRFREPRLGALGQEIWAGQGMIRLLQGEGRGSKISELLSSRGEGVIGVSVEVESVARARALIEKRASLRLPIRETFDGSSLLVPAERAHGLWLELFERP